MDNKKTVQEAYFIKALVGLWLNVAKLIPAGNLMRSVRQNGPLDRDYVICIVCLMNSKLATLANSFGMLPKNHVWEYKSGFCINRQN